VIKHDGVALLRGDYRDPLDILIRYESKTCAGCIFVMVAFGAQYCDKRKRYGKRCEFYREVENVGC
jgi:hypothetical protein